MYICCICMRYVDTKNSVCCICTRQSYVHLLHMYEVRRLNRYRCQAIFCDSFFDRWSRAPSVKDEEAKKQQGW